MNLNLKKFNFHLEVNTEEPQNWLIICTINGMVIYGLYIENALIEKIKEIGDKIKKPRIAKIQYICEYSPTKFLFEQIRKEYKNEDLIQGSWFLNHIQ